MRMPVENDSEHVPDFALVPVRSGPEVGDGGDAKAASSSRATLMRIYSFRSNERR